MASLAYSKIDGKIIRQIRAEKARFSSIGKYARDYERLLASKPEFAASCAALTAALKAERAAARAKLPYVHETPTRAVSSVLTLRALKAHRTRAIMAGNIARASQYDARIASIAA